MRKRNSADLKKNGKIELLRFVFAFAVLCFHTRMDCWETPPLLFDRFYLFPQGKLGVEFFFMLSGFLMAKSIGKEYRKSMDDSMVYNNLGNDTLHYIWRKIKVILPYHILFCTAALIQALFIKCHNLMGIITYIIKSIPSFLFLNSTGLLSNATGLIAPEWYLSSMFLVMLVLYPLTKRYFKTLPQTLYPLFAFLAAGYLVSKYGGFPGNNRTWGYLTLECNIRAAADLCMGIFAYKIYIQIERHYIRYRFILHVLEILSTAICLMLLLSYDDKTCTIFFILMPVVLCLTMSSNGIGYGNIIFQNKFIMFLGKISLPLYLCQNIVRTAMNNITDESFPPKYHFLIVVVVSTLIGTISVLLINRIQSCLFKKTIRK